MRPMALGDVLQTLASSLYVATLPFGIFFNKRIALCILSVYKSTIVSL